MFNLLLKILPLDFAATLSPVILALAVIILGSKLKPKASTLAFILGAVICGVIVSVVGIVFGNVIAGDKGTLTSAIIDIAMGIAFTAFAIKIIATKEKEKEPKEKIHTHPALKWFLIAIVLNITNFDAVFLLFTAAREVGLAQINDLDKIGLWAMNIAFYTLPALLPLIIYLIIPRQASVVLAKLNAVLTKYSRYIMFVLFILFGIYFLYRGIVFFV
ncbi:GAP family protein [Patescibacteria group bacterium]